MRICYAYLAHRPRAPFPWRSGIAALLLLIFVLGLTEALEDEPLPPYSHGETTP